MGACVRTGAYEIGARGLVPIDTTDVFPVGQLLHYSDRYCSRRTFVVTGATFGEYAFGQECICLEDGHKSTVRPAECDRPGYSWGYRKLDQIMPAEEMRVALAKAEAERVRLEEDRKLKDELEAALRQERREKCIAKYGSFLEQVKPDGYASAALGSKNLKRELQRAFPGIKFSVSSESYSGGDSITVRWTLGPSTDEVKAISNKYKKGHFNGMEDIYETDYENVWPELFGGTKHVFESHGAPQGAAEQIAEQLKTMHNYEGDQWAPGSDATKLILHQSFPAGAIITGIKRKDDTATGTWPEGWFEVTFTTPS
jgi:hypothetical protein